MFSAEIYRTRRAELRRKVGSGLILLPGNTLSPNNYPNNAYYFRQDSSFRYYFGLNIPSLTGLIDADSGEGVGSSATISPWRTSSGRAPSPCCATWLPKRESKGPPREGAGGPHPQGDLARTPHPLSAHLPGRG